MQNWAICPMDAHLIGDAKETLRALIPMLERMSDRSRRADIEENVAEWWRILDRQAHQEFGAAINPQLVAGELSGRLPDDTILTADSGSATTWWAPPPQAPARDASLSVGHPGHHGPRRAPHHDRPLRSAYCVGRISVSVATARRKAAWATGLLSIRQF
jgi:hypothetical protein